MTDKADALLSLCPNARWVVRGDVIEWNDTAETQPSEAEINAKIAELSAEKPIKLLRVKRDQLISETDWWASSDLTMSTERSTYRQALRDITNTYQSIDTVVWPTKPE